LRSEIQTCLKIIKLLHKQSKHTTHNQIVCTTACDAQTVWPCMGPFWSKVVGQTVGLKWAANKWLSLLCCEESLPHCCIGLTLMNRDPVCYVLSAVVAHPKIIKFLPHDDYCVNSWNKLRNVLWLYKIDTSRNKLCFVPLISLKQSRYMPGQARRVPWGWCSQISRQLACKFGKVVSPVHWLLLPPKKYSWYSFLLEAELIPGW
jgi:hypothetical protein